MHLLHVIVEFAIVLGFMVLVHELGHFAVAKWCGVRVEAFSIGFGPRLFGIRHGDTDYRISILPLGGYVKMAGEVPGEAATGDPGEFNAHPRWQRMFIAFAGPLANFILCFFLLLFLGMFHHPVDEYLDGVAVVDYVTQGSAAARAGVQPGDVITSFNGQANPHWPDVLYGCALDQHRSVPIVLLRGNVAKTSSFACALDEKATDPFEALLSLGFAPRVQAQPIKVSSVAGGTPADRAGLKAGDQIVRVDNLEVHSANPTMTSYLHDRNGAPVMLTVLRDGQTISISVTPEKMPTDRGESDYRLGFANRQPPTKIVHLGFVDASKESIKENFNNSTLVLRILKGIFTRHVSVKSMSGPVGIAQQIDIAVQNGYWSLVDFMSTISLQLGIMNLLPIPILDGGMILFLAIESVMRRDLNQEIKERVYQVAFVCLILFATFVLFNDITKLHR